MNLEFENIGHHYGETPALANINLLARSGEITCLLGSSGCGKSTLLNLAAGLLELQSGKISLDGEALAQVGSNPAPEDRPIGLVFQKGALFPHMTIADNILFGVGKAERSPTMVDDWLGRIGLSGLGARFPNSLSGGQQQRVALARAMAPNPAVLLLDEPFASIDVVLRKSLRRECRRLLKERGATAIMVTHDPEEAMDIGDQIAVMEGGQIVQIGSPDTLYSQPATVSVANMLGDSQSFHGLCTQDGLETPFGTWPQAALANGDKISGKVQFIARENTLEITPDTDGLEMRDLRPLGHATRITLANKNGEEISVCIPLTQELGDAKRFSIRPQAASVIAFPFIA